MEEVDTSNTLFSKFSSHGADDVVQALTTLLGKPAHPEKLKDYDDTHAATKACVCVCACTFVCLFFKCCLFVFADPDAFVGTSTHLRDTMLNLILNSPQNWHTSAMLPFQKIEGTVVEWDVSWVWLRV